jgi:hypothetical protein
MQNPFAHGNFRDRSRPFLVVVVILLALLFGAAFFVKPAWRAIKDRRAEAFVENAKRAMVTNNAAMAANHLRAAFAISPALPSVNRALAEHYTRLHHPDALNFWRSLDDQGMLSFDEQLQFAELAIELNATEVAAHVVEIVGAQQPDNPDCLQLLARLYLMRGERARALAVAEEAMRKAPRRRDLVKFASELQLRHSASPAIQAEAKRRLLSEVIAGGDEGVAAARALIVHGTLEAEEVSLLRQLLSHQTGTGFAPKLAILLLDLRQQPGAAPEILNRFRQSHLSGVFGDQFRQTLQALLEADLTATIKDLLADADVLDSSELTSIRLESLGRCHDWASMERLIELPRKQPLPKAISQVYRAMAAELAGRTNEVDQLWTLAVSANLQQPEILRLIALRAEESGNWHAAGAAWRRLVGFPDRALQAAQQLVRIGEHRGDLSLAYEGTRKLTQRWPARTDLRFELGRLQMLLGLAADEVGDSLAKAALEPKSPAAAVLLALGDLQANKGEQAVERFAGIGIDWGTAREGWRVIYAASLAASGQFAAARQIAAGLNDQQLSAQELMLIKNLLAQPGR